jgi:hypothetical protein
MSFIYNFDISKEIPHFKNSPQHIQSTAEYAVVEVIYESFVVTGDQDYLMARLLAQHGLPRGFFWAAAQAMEKYLKAFLLMNGLSVKNFSGHPIKKLFEAAIKIDSSFAEINILPHPNFIIEPSVSHHLKKFTAHEFIDEIEKHGNPNNRYNAIGIEYSTGHLCALDSFSFRTREKIGCNPINESLNNLSPDLIEIFNKFNPWFQAGTDHPPIQVSSKELPIQRSSSVTKFEIITGNNINPSYKIALQWLGAKMKLPSKNGK